MASLLHTLDKLNFEVPLAVALGASTAFATIAAPPGAIDDLALGRVPLAALLALVSAPVAWLAMRKPRAAPPAIRPAEEAVTADDDLAVPVVRMRRADRHPDAPACQPIRANRDLGTPFMAVGANEVPPAASELQDEPMTVESDGIVIETAEAETAMAETMEVKPVELESLAASEPVILDIEDEPEAVVRQPRDNISAMMERLTQGVERRGGVPPRRSPAALARSAEQLRDIQPGLRDALATLNRLAERR